MLRLIPLIPLWLMICSDFRKRRIALIPLLIFALLQSLFVLYSDGYALFIKRLLANNLFLILIGGIVLFYYKRKGKNIRREFGLGDLLFLITLTPAFDPRCFLLFHTIIFSLTLAVWYLLVLFRFRPLSIPLVSAIGIGYTLYTIALSIYLHSTP